MNATRAVLLPHRLTIHHSTTYFHLSTLTFPVTRSQPPFYRLASSSSSTRWKTRQSSDAYTRAAKLSSLKSRAAFKLLEIQTRHRILRPGDTVVDLGYAPGSWSQVAVAKTAPGGRVVGIDVIPAQPPRGASGLQGDFLRGETQERLREFVREGRGAWEGVSVGVDVAEDGVMGEEEGGRKEVDDVWDVVEDSAGEDGKDKTEVLSKASWRKLDEKEGRVVDVVLSDMSAPWPLVMSTWVKSVNNPYIRMMNTSGMAFRDHAGSMDLCFAALTFCYDTLRTGGHFLCKFYAGQEDHAFEMRLKKLFEKVHRIKPDSSRKESKEAYFVAMKRRHGIAREAVLAENG